MGEKIKAIHRIFQYIEYKHIPPTNLEKKVGLSNGYLGTQLKRNADIGEGVFVKIINYCLDINPLWLITGKGEMIENKTDDLLFDKKTLSDNRILLKLIHDKDLEIKELYKQMCDKSEEIGRLKEQNESKK